MNTEFIKSRFFHTLEFFIKEFDAKPEFIYENEEGCERYEITLVNNEKKITLYLLEGVNVDGISYKDCDLHIKYLGEDKRSYKWTWFLLKDYCNYINIKPFSYYEHGQSLEDRVILFFDFIKDILINHGLKDLLKSKGWKVIPIDMSPYK